MKEKTKSIKSIFVSAVLLMMFMVSAFVLVGCGEVSLDTLSENYQAMQEQVSLLTEKGIFSGDSGDVFGVETSYVVSYGELVDGYVETGYEEYEELQSLYNSILVYANAYTESVISIILSTSEEEITDDVQNAINNLNSSVVAYTNSLSDFVSSRDSLISHFEKFSSSGTPNNETDLAALLLFKRTYGQVVDYAVEMSVCCADVIDEVQIMEFVQDTTLSTDDISDLQAFINAKTLQIFSNLLLKEIANQVNWSKTLDNGDKSRLTAMISAYESTFQTYKSFILLETTFVDGEVTQETLYSAFETALSAFDDFCVEMEDFQTALSGLSIATLATSPYNNDLSEYLADNEFAEIYLQKLEQFVAYSIPNFISYIAETLSLE